MKKKTDFELRAVKSKSEFILNDVYFIVTIDIDNQRNILSCHYKYIGCYRAYQKLIDSELTRPISIYHIGNTFIFSLKKGDII